MKAFHIVIIIVLSSFLLVLGCQVSPQEEKTTTGVLKIEIPEYAPWLSMERGGSRATAQSYDYDMLSSRAYLLASETLFELYDSSMNFVADITVTGGSATSWEVDAGTDYYLYAWVFNTYYSSSTPTVYGYESGVDVTAGQTTNVTVTCFPYSPVALTEGVSSSGYNIPQSAEMWFYVQPTTTNTYFNVHSTGTTDADIYVFGPDGSFLGSSTSINPVDTVQLSTSVGSYYYIGIYAYATTGDPFYVLVDTAPILQDDIYDIFPYDNDTASATSATIGPISELTWYYNLIQADDDWYEISVTPGFNQVDIECLFTHNPASTYDVDLVLLDANLNVIAYSYSTTDNEYISALVDPAGGTYYILVYYGDMGTSYDLWWDDVIPPADDIYDFSPYDNDTASATSATIGPISELTWYYNLIQADDDWYEISVTPGFNRVLIECLFTHNPASTYDIDLELYDANLNGIAYSWSQDDNEYIDVVVDPAGGTYYILVYYGNMGTYYDLWWDDVQP